MKQFRKQCRHVGVFKSTLDYRAAHSGSGIVLLYDVDYFCSNKKTPALSLSLTVHSSKSANKFPSLTSRRHCYCESMMILGFNIKNNSDVGKRGLFH